MRTRITALVTSALILLGLVAVVPATADLRDDGLGGQAAIPGVGNICDYHWSACFRRPFRP